MEKIQATNKLISLSKDSPQIWRVTLNNPPVNIYGPKSIPQVEDVLVALETDPQVKVVIFESAIVGFFMTHYDFVSPAAETNDLPPGPTGLLPWPDQLVRLSRAPVISIAKIRGRATGCGSELALACDMRFASREKTIMGHFEVGVGIVPGGGPMARLPRLMGRGRALEILLSADDFPGDIAEKYGYVNRAFPDAELDGFVDNLARRIASFDRQAISQTKHFVDVASLPPDYEVGAEMVVCGPSIGRPETQRRIKPLLDRGLHKAGDVETRLGYHVAQLGAPSPLTASPLAAHKAGAS
jgi:enoyl-CoA hydratase/carnithine racemase